MRGTPIVNLIRYIKNQKKLNELNTYLSRGYSDKRNPTWRLWQNLKEGVISRSNKSPKLDVRVIDRHIFGLTKPVKGKHPRIKSVKGLLMEIKSFSILNYLNKRKLIFEWLFLKSVQKDTPDIYRQTLPRLRTMLKHTKDIDNEWYRYVAHHYYWEQYRSDNSNAIPKLEDLKLSHQYLQQFYYQRLSLLNSEIQDRNQVLGENNPLFVNHSTSNKAASSTLIVDFVKELQIFNVHSGKLLQKFDALITKFEQMRQDVLIPSNDLSKVFERLVNIATVAFRNNNQKLLKFHWNYFEKVGFKEGLLLENGNLPIKQYINFMSIVTAMKDVDKLTAFATTYIEKVSEEDEHIAIHFKDIFIAFHNENYEDVIEIISKNEQSVTAQNNNFLKIRRYTFLIRSHYEIEVEYLQMYNTPTTELNYNLSLFESFLSRNTMEESLKIASNNFIKTLQTLRKKPKVKGLITLMKYVLSVPIIHQTWLLKKIEEAIDSH